jgi:bifunctional NMN adenylyltransferase/nudix hydrolase
MEICKVFKSDFAVYIGRFQPFHNGHNYVLHQALRQGNDVIVVLGSSYGPRTIKNPFNEVEREDMIRACLSEEDNLRTHFVAVEDSAYNDHAWATDVVNAVDGVAKGKKVVLVGYEKDASTFYLRMFPQWRYVDVGAMKTDDGVVVNATAIRDQLFRNPLRGIVIDDVVPTAVNDFLYDFEENEAFKQLCHEASFIRKYRAAWADSPYPPTFFCVDAVVVQQGHILLIQRRAEPGKGLWALPGGFLNQNERIADATLRELVEETRLKVPARVLTGCIEAVRVFDAPDRSLRGRMLTHATLFHLPPHGDKLPEVKGDDDAMDAKWWPLTDVKRLMLFDDHMDIIKHLTARL